MVIQVFLVMKFMNRWGSEVYERVSGSIDLNLRELIDRKKLRFMGNAALMVFWHQKWHS